MADTATRQLRTVSYGGGVQSTALLVLAVRHHIDYRIFLFANVGDDSEHPLTLRYVREIAMPYAAEHGIELHELHRTMRDGTRRTLYDDLVNPNHRSVDIPVRMAGSGAPGMRNCTHKYKREVVNRWLAEHGADEDSPAVCAIGISTDEVKRSRTDSGYPNQIRVEPLIDLDLSRQDCANIIVRAGLPLPPKSACWFCPFKKLDQWRDQKRDEPDLFAKAADLERVLNAKRESFGKDEVYLTRALRPLPIAVGPGIQEQLPLDGCDGGVCFT